MATYKENRDFAESIIPVNSLLDDAIDYIKRNLNITDVFDQKDVLEFVKDNFTVSDVFTDINIVETFSEEDIRNAAREIGIIDISEYRDLQLTKIL